MMTMSVEVEANKNTNDNEGAETKVMLQELNELMDYIDADDNSDNEELIDPAFFIGNINESIPDVPTLTTVANEPAIKNSKVQSETSKQPGLFSARVERFKQSTPLESTAPESKSDPVETLNTQSSGNTQPSEEDVNRIVDALVEEQLPKLEAQLRERILASIQNKKEF